MNSKKKITISFRDRDQKEQKNELIQAKKEQAAATDPKRKDYKTYVEGSDSNRKLYQLPFKKSKNRQSPIKHLVITSLIALFISLGLGFLLLRMFVTLTDQTALEEIAPVTSQPSEEVTQTSSPDGLLVNPTSIETYIVQAGVFTTVQKANEWKNMLTDQSVPTVIWERDGRFYLFAGSAPTKAEADTKAAELTSRNIEAYVKTWSVLKGDGAFSGVEADIVETLVNHLEQHSLDALSASDREQLITKLERDDSDSPISAALSGWDQDTDLIWLKVAKSLEEVLK